MGEPIIIREYFILVGLMILWILGLGAMGSLVAVPVVLMAEGHSFLGLGILAVEIIFGIPAVVVVITDCHQAAG